MSGEPGPDPSEFLKSLGQHFQRISFGGGVVNKTAYALLSVCPVWAIVAWRLSESLILDSALLMGGIFWTVSVLWWIQKTHQFAEKNPVQAMLSGTEFIEYQKFEAQAKGSPSQGASKPIEAAIRPSVSSEKS